MLQQGMGLFRAASVLYPEQISRFSILVPLQLQNKVGWLCGHTPIFLQGWELPLPQLDDAPAVVHHFDH